jgi:hypothetical protein
MPEQRAHHSRRRRLAPTRSAPAAVSEFIGATTAPDTINPDDSAQQYKLIGPACWHLLSTYVGLSLSKLAQRRDIGVIWTGIFRDSVKLGEHRARCYVDATANHLFNRSLKGLGAKALHV